MIKYQAEFEGYLKSTRLKGNENAAEIIKALNGVSKYLGINISSNNLGSDEDMKDFSKRLTQIGKLSPKALRQFQAAMQHYVNMVNGL